MSVLIQSKQRFSVTSLKYLSRNTAVSAAFGGGCNLKKMDVREKIHVVTVHKDDKVPASTPPVAGPSGNHEGQEDKIMCSIPLSKIKLKKRGPGRKKKDPAAIRAHRTLKEKQRRDSMKECYQEVRRRIPSLRDNPKAPIAIILRDGEKYVKTVQERRRKLLRRLRKEQLEREDIISSLKEHAV